jgi:hypothetical protein
MSTFTDFLGMTSCTLSILFLDLKPIVKKLFSIEIVTFPLKQNLGRIKWVKYTVTSSCLKQT